MELLVAVYSARWGGRALCYSRTVDSLGNWRFVRPNYVLRQCWQRPFETRNSRVHTHRNYFPVLKVLISSVVSNHKKKQYAHLWAHPQGSACERISRHHWGVAEIWERDWVRDPVQDCWTCAGMWTEGRGCCPAAKKEKRELECVRKCRHLDI